MRSTRLVRLIGAHCLETNDEWLQRRHLRMDPERVEEAVAAWPEAAEPSACCFGPLRSQHAEPWRCTITQCF